MRIVLIVADTFRYDHVAPNKKVTVSTPELDALRKDSIWFDNCYSGSFPTVPHRYDLMTGRYRFPFGWWSRISSEEITLAETLMDYGYVTQMITDTGNILGRGMNFDRGFLSWNLIRGQERDMYHTKMNQPIKKVMDPNKTRDFKYFDGSPQVDLAHWINSHWQREEDRFAPQVARHAANWIEDNSSCEDFLLYLDFFDPHEPWDPPDFFIEKYQPGYKGDPMILPNYGLADAYTPDELENFKARYKGEVEMVSKWLGRVFRQMKDVGVYDDSLIIFTSDHGTMFGEHNSVGKSNISKDDNRGPWPLYNELIHVPLMVKLPKNKNAGLIVDELVQAVDIFPTITELAGINPETPFPGKAALPAREIIHVGMDGVAIGRESGLNPMHGHSLLKVVNKQTWPRKAAFSCMHLGPLEKKIVIDAGEDANKVVMPWLSVNGRGYTLMLGGREEDGPKLFDLSQDPGQEDNIYDARHPMAIWLTECLFDFLESVGAKNKHVELLKGKIA
jgi:arylsulfatase A-like enzyme